MILAPAVALRFRRVRETPRALLNMSASPVSAACSIASFPPPLPIHPLHSTAYFPSVPELVMAAGYIALGSVAFVLAVNYFAVLPGEAAPGTTRSVPSAGRERHPNLHQADGTLPQLSQERRI
jgi:Ni/Fe-hydrogenase subunit HybB-like protein